GRELRLPLRAPERLRRRHRRDRPRDGLRLRVLELRRPRRRGQRRVPAAALPGPRLGRRRVRGRAARLARPRGGGRLSDMPRVTAVTIFLNAAAFLREAVASVLAQTWDDWELLLVDDGSTDGSGAIARALAGEHAGRIRYLTHPGGVNRGMSASR